MLKDGSGQYSNEYIIQSGQIQEYFNRGSYFVEINEMVTSNQFVVNVKM